MQRTDWPLHPKDQSKWLHTMFCSIFSLGWKETIINSEGRKGPYCTRHFLSQVSLAIAHFKLTHHSGGCRSDQTMPQVPSTSQVVGPVGGMTRVAQGRAMREWGYMRDWTWEGTHIFSLSHHTVAQTKHEESTWEKA